MFVDIALEIVFDEMCNTSSLNSVLHSVLHSSVIIKECISYFLYLLSPEVMVQFFNL